MYLVLLGLFLAGGASAQVTVEGVNCSSNFILDIDGPGPIPPMDQSCPPETPVFLDVYPQPFCFAVDDEAVAMCFITVPVKCKATGYFSGCRKYYKCVSDGNGGFTKTSYDCEMPKVFSEKYGSCVDRKYAPECHPWGGCPPKVGFHRDPQDCTKFYYCGLNTTANATSMDPAIEMKCPPGHFFKSKMNGKKCVPWQSADTCDFSVDPGSGSVQENSKCVKEGVIPDPDEDPTADPKQMFIMCFPIGGGKYGGVEASCADISPTAFFSPGIEGCAEPCA